MFRPAFRRLLLIILLFTSATLLSAADFPVAKKKRAGGVAPETPTQGRDVLENPHSSGGQGDEVSAPAPAETNLPSIGKPAKQLKGREKLRFTGTAIREPEDGDEGAESVTEPEPEPAAVDAEEPVALPVAKEVVSPGANTDADGPGQAIARSQKLETPATADAGVTANADDDQDEEEAENTSAPAGKKSVARREKLPFEGWDEYHATLAIHQWLKQNPTFADLAATEQEEVTDHFLSIMFSGEMNPSVVRTEIRGQRFKSTASLLTAPLAERLPDRLLFDYQARNFGDEPEAHRITVPAPVGERNISIASPDFPLWLENALRQPTAEKNQPIDWKIFPSIRNRYGRIITPRMYVMSVILIESAGIHRRKNKLYNAQGFYGFMQLGASYKRYQVSEPQNNLLHGVRHLYPCLHKTLVKDEKLRRNSRPEDRLIMASVCYNRGRYSKASKLTWPQLLKATPSTPFQKKKYFGLHDNRVAVKYGIQTKAYLGLPLAREEKQWIRNFTGVKDVDDWCNRKYGTMRNAILGRVRLSEKYGS